MAALALQLLRSQQLTHAAACAERAVLQHGGGTFYEAHIAELHAEARRRAGQFASYADYHPQSNDEQFHQP